MSSINGRDNSTRTNQEVKERPKVAFLGPEGTYSHQATSNHFGDEVEYIPKETIAETFKCVALEASVAVIPAENSIFGAVIETLDLLRLPEVGKEKVITGEITLEVQHCLLVARGTKLEDVKNVLSHEQALGQCSNYLKKHLPDATSTKMSSTGAAAEAVLAQEARYCSAAICSEVCSKVFPDLVLLEKGIQNEGDNFTKFWIVESSSVPTLIPTNPRNALIRASPLRQPADLALLIRQLGLAVLTIDRRPSVQSTPFHDVYFLRVAYKPQTETNILEALWRDRVEAALTDAWNNGWQACALGFW